MSWSINAKGKKADVKSRLTNPQEVSHVQGKERELVAEKAIALALDVVEATAEKFDINVAMHGSASFENAGEQTGQAIGVTVNFSLTS